MSRSHHDTTRSVSLFPFLAVLMCAMGALIFLLLVTTRRLRQQAIARAEQHRRQQAATTRPVEPRLPLLQPLPRPNRRSQPIETASAPPAVDPNIALRAAVARLSRRRDDLRGNLNRTRQKIAALKQQRNAVEAAAVTARSKLASIGHQQELERIAQRSLLKQQTGLNGRIRQAAERLETIQHTNATAQSRYAVLPFDAKTGTTRRPILIECTRDGLRFLPEQVALSRNDLDGFTIGYNPLLAGARSLIRYWSGFAGFSRKRPSLPREDSGGRRHKPANPESSLGREGRLRGEPAKPDGLKPYVLLIVRPGGSIPFYMARKFLTRLGEPFGYELLEADHKLAIHPVDPGAQAAVRNAVDAVLAERARLAATIGRGRGVAGRGGRTVARGTRTGWSAAGGRSNRHGPGTGARSGTGRFAGGRSAGGRYPDTGRRGTRDGSSAGGPRNHRYRSGPGAQADTGTIAGGSSAGRTPGATGRRSGSRSGSRSEDALGNGTQPAGISGRSTAISGQIGQNPTGQNPTGRKLAGQNPTGRNPTGRKLAGQNPTGQNPTGQNPTGQSSPHGGQTGGRPSQHRVGTGSGQTTATAAGRPSGSHRAYGGNAPQPFPHFGQTAGAGSPSANMMHRPRRWGLANRRTGIGFERNVNVTVDATRIVVGDRQVVPIGRGETRKQLIDQVAAAIDREARAWGPPPAGFYWVPNIQFDVHPGGNQFYERLNPAFRQWGLSTSARFPVGSSDRLDQRGLNE